MMYKVVAVDACDKGLVAKRPCTLANFLELMMGMVVFLLSLVDSIRQQEDLFLW